MTRLLATALAAAALCAAGAATAQTKIKIADSFPVGHYLPKYFTTPMMERLKADPAAKGIEFEYYPAEQLGKAKDLLSLTQSGLVDIAYVGPGFVSDKMPLSVVPELPLPYTGSCQATMAYWNLAKHGGLLDKKDFAPNGVRLLFTIVLPPYQVITRKPFASLSDLDGMKIRASGSAKELLLKKLKAVPVLMPTPEVYESLSRGTIDGVLFPFNSLAPYGLDKLSKTGTIGSNFGSFVANWVISEKRFQSLPPAVQKDLTTMGEELVQRVCKQVEQDEAADIEKTRAAGVELTPLSKADEQALQRVAAEVATEWAQNLDRRGKGGTEVLNAFRAGLGLK
ncbi:MAG: TRAP transporter substrate-binding protein DctP [Burkholderiaceae bacterium]|nr:TRAP transporter substrate-binding protein DctP [Pseudomonadota bacterium]MBS0598682.1 TRAP transporter substrate-binding protein DctP [Pseudomonadota bacterium]MCO5115963.1 TRAP transporter substrate-binding protein DctP [Burkholderiaceae bacterium]MCP5216957.1 TRAP transporter substrate-binding protein DctP [Burkholderiaceae bacterium]